MSGGAGRDTFVFLDAESGIGAMARDAIGGFNAGGERTTVGRIDLSAIDADLTAAGDQAFEFIGRAAFQANDPCTLRFSLANGNTIVAVNTDGDTQAELQLVLPRAIFIL
jgi:serralysin